MRTVLSGRITGKCNDMFDCSRLREYMALGSGVLHAFGKRAVDSCYGQRRAVDLAPGLRGGIVQQLHDPSRSDQIAPGKSRAITEHDVAVVDPRVSLKIRPQFPPFFAADCPRLS